MNTVTFQCKPKTSTFVWTTDIVKFTHCLVVSKPAVRLTITNCTQMNTNLWLFAPEHFRAICIQKAPKFTRFIWTKRTIPFAIANIWPRYTIWHWAFQCHVTLKISTAFNMPSILARFQLKVCAQFVNTNIWQLIASCYVFSTRKWLTKRTSSPLSSEWQSHLSFVSVHRLVIHVEWWTYFVSWFVEKEWTEVVYAHVRITKQFKGFTILFGHTFSDWAAGFAWKAGLRMSFTVIWRQIYQIGASKNISTNKRSDLCCLLMGKTVCWKSIVWFPPIVFESKCRKESQICKYLDSIASIIFVHKNRWKINTDHVKEKFERFCIEYFANTHNFSFQIYFVLNQFHLPARSVYFYGWGTTFNVVYKKRLRKIWLLTELAENIGKVWCVTRYVEPLWLG